MKRTCQIVFLFIFLLPLEKAHAQEKYAGEWTMVSMKFQVTVESWGEHCGLKPSSYSSDKKVSVLITSKGKHLIFSKGNLRTDRCGSPNPRLRTLQQSATDGKWVRVCETESNDSKYEHGKYTLVAKNSDKLEYLADSKFDWTLQNDHCVAYSKESRVYVRAKTDAEDEPAETPPPPEPTLDEWESPPPPAGQQSPTCESSGLPKRLVVQPRRIELGPGERFCFKANAIDAAGCSHLVNPKWQVSQDGKKVTGLMNQTGCFVTGDTAADSEGLYKVEAKYRGKTDFVEVSVVFPDIAELLAARLKPLDDITAPNQDDSDVSQQENASKDPEKNQEATPPVEISTTVPQESNRNSKKLIFVILLAIVLIIGASLLFLAIKKRTSEKRQNKENLANWLQEIDKSDKPKSHKAENRPSNLVKTEIGKKNSKCPKCGGTFPSDARFCPEDGSHLIPEKTENIDESRSSSHLLPDGKVCPECHRGYDISAKYCPHDSEILIPYSEWRAKKLK